MYDAIQGTGTNAVLTLFTDAFVIKGGLETRQRRVTDMLNLAEDPFLVLADVTFDEFGTLRAHGARRLRPGEPRLHPLRGRRHARGTGAGAADAQDRAARHRLDPAVQGHGLHPPARRAKPARRARRAHRPVPAGHRGDVLVRHARRAARRPPPSSRSTGPWPRSWRRTRRSTRGPASTRSCPPKVGSRPNRRPTPVRPPPRPGPRTRPRHRARRRCGPRGLGVVRRGSLGEPQT